MLENLIGKKPEGQRVDATGLLGFANGGEARVGGSAPAVAGRTGRAAQLAAQRADEPQTESRAMLERLDAATPVERAVFESTGMEPGLDRAMMLPFAGSREEGNLQLAAPGFVYDAARAFVTPGMAARGQQVSDEDILNTAMNVMGGGVGASRVAGPRTAPDEMLLGMGVGSRDTPTAADDLAALTERVPSPATKNVEEIFNLDQRATNADLPKSRDTLVFMSPDDFLAMAAPTRADYSFTSSEGKEKTKSILAGIQKGDLIDVPHLKIFDKDGVAQVEGHDGRHRAALMKELGYDRMPVIINSHRIRWADQLKSGRDQIEGSWPTVLRSEKDPWGKINKESRDIPFPVKDPRPSADDLAALTAKAPTDTPEFKNFFGESKVVDAKGKPMQVYHGTSSDFTVFRPSEDGRLGRGIYLSSEERLAKGFRGADKLMRLYVSMQNPAYEYDLIPERVGNKMKGDEYEKELHNRAIGGGFDGIIKGSSTDVFGNPRTSDSWGNFVVFNPTQIKSAIGNEGTFDPTNPVITKAKGGAVTKNNVERMRNDNRKYL
jgi:hypothetical protein